MSYAKQLNPTRRKDKKITRRSKIRYRLQTAAAVLRRHLALAPPPAYVELESSALVAASHDPRRQALLIRFRNGRSYEYGCVVRSVFEELVGAESAGAYFNRAIRDNYPYRELAA